MTTSKNYIQLNEILFDISKEMDRINSQGFENESECRQALLALSESVLLGIDAQRLALFALETFKRN